MFNTTLGANYGGSNAREMSDGECERKKGGKSVIIFERVIFFACANQKQRSDYLHFSQHVASLDSQFISVAFTSIFLSLLFAFVDQCVTFFLFSDFSFWTESVKLFCWELNCVQNFLCTHLLSGSFRERIVPDGASKTCEWTLICACTYKHTWIHLKIN